MNPAKKSKKQIESSTESHQYRQNEVFTEEKHNQKQYSSQQEEVLEERRITNETERHTEERKQKYSEQEGNQDNNQRVVNTPINKSSKENNPKIRVITNNMAGMGIRTGKFENILQWLDNHSADIYLGQEVNISKNHDITKKYLRSPSFIGKHVVISKTKWKFETEKKPGGTMCISNQKLRSRIQRTISDSMGRWAGNVYQFKNGIKIAIISTYQSLNKTEKGTTTIAAQQIAMLREMERDINPRKAFKEDIVALIKSLKEDNIEIIVSAATRETQESYLS